jgi:outer membrane protein
MTSLMRLVSSLAVVAACANSVFAQTASPTTSASPIPQTTQSPRAAAPAFPDGARLAYVDINRVAALSGEGKAAAAKLEALRSKKSTEVSERGKQLEALQQKLSGGAVLNDVARARLEREFQRAQTDFQRFTEDAQAEVQATEQQLLQAFTTRLFPVIGQVATEKNLWAVFSSESGLLWHNPALDLSEEVAKRLDSATTPKK